MGKTIKREKTFRKLKEVNGEKFRKHQKIKKFKDFIYEDEEELDEEDIYDIKSRFPSDS